MTFSNITKADNRNFPPGTDEVFIPKIDGVRTDILQNIQSIINKSIVDGYYPGAIVLASHEGTITYRGIFGNKRILPDVLPMSFDTIFDVASLTKVVVTTPAIMQLIEQGKCTLDDTASKYWSEFKTNNKENITIRQLLTHTSGLPAEISTLNWQGKSTALRIIEQLKPICYPGKIVVYSDVNFIVLGHLIELITGETISSYAQKYILHPLGMYNTSFSPDLTLREKIAPTELTDNELRWGEVHDPTAYAMGGVAGSAGLFSTAGDLGIYAQCIIEQGKIRQNNLKAKEKNDYRLLGPLTILKMTTVQTPPWLQDARGFGWDIDSSSSNRGILFPTDSFGHTGWTGTSLWISPKTKSWLVILTSRTHSSPAMYNKLIDDRKIIANIIAASLTNLSIDNISNTSAGEIDRAYGNRF